MILSVATTLGSKTLSLANQVGTFCIFIYETIKIALTSIPRVNAILVQTERIGVQSLPIVILTGSFTGMVFALQSYVGFARFGAEQFIGATVALALIKELGPVLTGLMVTGRAGSAIAAELGTMQVSEQIDALKTLHIDPFSYLIVPRIVAATLIMPFLALICMVCGIAGGYVVCAQLLDVNTQEYIANIATFVDLKDIVGGLLKSLFFGFLISLIGCYKGYCANGGARGVGLATTQAVVAGSVAVLITNYVLTQLLETL